MLRRPLAVAAICLAATTLAFSDDANAHFPTVSAVTVCADGQPAVEFVSQSYLFESPGGENPAVSVEVSLDFGPWFFAALGEYADPLYSFSGIIPLPAGATNVRVRTRLLADWADGFINTDAITYAADAYAEADEANATVFAIPTDCVEICGDGEVGPEEECDDGNSDDTDACRNDCTVPMCGDGILDSGEACDDGNDVDTDTCRNDCTAPFCGDGIEDPNEGCDDGNNDDGDGCDANCSVEEIACDIKVEKYCSVASNSSLLCEAKIAATTLRYVGPDAPNSTVSIVGGTGSALYTGVDLFAGTVLASAAENGFSVDGRPGDLSAKTTIVLNGEPEVIHTSCSAIYEAGLPAPLDNPKGDPSPNWEVVNFVDKNGGAVSETDAEQELSNECVIAAVDKTSSKKKKKSKKKGKKKSKKKSKKKKAASNAASDVEYTYVVRNVGTTTAFDVVAVDDVLGELTGSPVAELPAGQSIEFTEVVEQLSATVTNTVFVSAANAAGQICEADASATVTVETPPVSCADGKPTALTFLVTTGGPCPGDNTQTKDSCSGDTGPAPFLVSTEDREKVGLTAEGSSVTFSARDGGKLPSELKVMVGDQSLNIHASCSDDLILGQSFGSMTLTGFTPVE